MTKLTVTAAKAIKVGNAKHELVVVPLFTNQALAGQSAAVDAAAGGVLQRAIDLGEAEAKLGKVTSMIGTESVARIVAVGCGDREQFDRDAQLAVTGAIGRSLAASKAKAGNHRDR
jgi:leucyl aminopeptidase